MQLRIALPRQPDLVSQTMELWKCAAEKEEHVFSDWELAGLITLLLSSHYIMNGAVLADRSLVVEPCRGSGFPAATPGKRRKAICRLC